VFKYVPMVNTLKIIQECVFINVLEALLPIIMFEFVLPFALRHQMFMGILTITSASKHVRQRLIFMQITLPDCVSQYVHILSQHLQTD